MQYRFLVVAAFVSSSLGAQTFVSLLPAHDQADAPSLSFVAGLGGDRRQQLVFSERALQPLQKAQLTGIEFRRDAGYDNAVPAIKATFTLNASVARNTWDRVAATFAVNSGTARTLLFSGAAMAPASSKPGPKHQPWAKAHTLSLPFSSSYTYASGDLCLDIDARVDGASRNGFWPVDGVVDWRQGQVVPFGSDCGGWRATDGWKSHGEPATLRIGATTRVTSFGRPGCTGIFLLGLAKVDLDLGVMGAKGCRLYVQPWIQFPIAYNKAELTGIPDRISIPYHVPPSNDLRGATAYVQFVDNETPLHPSLWTNASGLTTGNGLQLTISGALPQLGLTSILSHVVDANMELPTWGRVSMTAAPIVRFSHK